LGGEMLHAVWKAGCSSELKFLLNTETIKWHYRTCTSNPEKWVLKMIWIWLKCDRGHVVA
jgi:hypothetical protein